LFFYHIDRGYFGGTFSPPIHLTFIVVPGTLVSLITARTMEEKVTMVVSLQHTPIHL